MTREQIIVILLLIVTLIHVVTIIVQPQYAKDTIEIVKYVVIAIISFYLGYSFKREEYGKYCNMEKIEHLKIVKSYKYNKMLIIFTCIGYAIAFGIVMDIFTTVFLVIASILIYLIH